MITNFFFLNDTATTEIYTLSLHDALPISLRADLPIYIAAEGPKNVALAAEIADGWLPMFYAPRVDGFYRDALTEGFARPGARHSAQTFEVACLVPVLMADDVESAADMYRPVLALYIGGMGAREVNFHNNVFARMGYEG